MFSTGYADFFQVKEQGFNKTVIVRTDFSWVDSFMKDGIPLADPDVCERLFKIKEPPMKFKKILYTNDFLCSFHPSSGSRIALFNSSGKEKTEYKVEKQNVGLYSERIMDYFEFLPQYSRFLTLEKIGYKLYCFDVEREEPIFRIHLQDSCPQLECPSALKIFDSGRKFAIGGSESFNVGLMIDEDGIFFVYDFQKYEKPICNIQLTDVGCVKYISEISVPSPALVVYDKYSFSLYDQKTWKETGSSSAQERTGKVEWVICEDSIHTVCAVRESPSYTLELYDVRKLDKVFRKVHSFTRTPKQSYRFLVGIEKIFADCGEPCVIVCFTDKKSGSQFFSPFRHNTWEGCEDVDEGENETLEEERTVTCLISMKTGNILGEYTSSGMTEAISVCSSPDGTRKAKMNFEDGKERAEFVINLVEVPRFEMVTGIVRIVGPKILLQ